MPLLGAQTYLQQTLNTFNVVAYLGHWGAYKTYTAQLTASYLIKMSRKHNKVYSNIPITFADSPPLEKGKIDLENFTQLDYEEIINDFDFTAKYAENAIYVFDEAWLAFSEYDKKLMMDIFAFPRKRNQIFLLTSALELGGIGKYCKLIVEKDFNFQVFGLPLIRMKSQTPSDKKPLKWFIAMPNVHYSNYSTGYEAFSEKPILQYRDYGILYSNETHNAIPRMYSKFFVVNWRGLAEHRSNLTEQDKDILANFEILEENKSDDRFETKFPKAPKMKKKMSFSVSGLLGTEFNILFAGQFLILVWFMLATAFYLFNFHDTQVRPWHNSETMINFITFQNMDSVKATKPETANNESGGDGVIRIKTIEQRINEESENNE